MDKTAIKKFAIWARNKLIADSVYRARLLGITDKEIQNPLPQSTKDAQFFDIGLKEPAIVMGDAIAQRNNLVAVIREKAKDISYPEAFSRIMEDTAYTWFNRLIAIRFMEVNNYLPGHVRVLSSDNPEKIEPDLVTSPFDSDLTFSEDESRQIVDWKTNNQTDDLFRMLFLKECNALNEPLPMLFETIADYTELLLTLTISDRDGVVWHLVHDIPEDDFRDQVQIIGWFYQYYNTEPKDKVFARKSSEKIKKEDIPAATQLFTPDWIVRYMVENSLGRLWVEGHPNEDLKGQWKYYLDEAKQEEDVQKQLNQIYAEHSKLNPEDLTCLDPCCGSGHILVYMFDVLMQIYQSRGYRDRDAAISIVEHNLYGLDIDERAAQLAYFAVMMKARQYDRRFLNRGLQPHIYAIEESNGLSKWSDMRGQTEGEQMNLDDQFVNLADELIDTFWDAKNYGSLLQVEPGNYDGLLDYMQQLLDEGCNNLFLSGWLQEVAERMPKLVRQAKLLRQKYWVCVTNPPYMGAGNMNRKLSDFVKKNYADYKSDMFSACMVRFTQMTEEKGFLGFLSPYVWMFISSYEKLRELFIQQKTIQTLIQFEYSAFEEATVPICTFVLCNHYINKKGVYFRLTDYKGGMEVQREKMLEALATHDKTIYFESNAANFSKIPGKTIAYWIHVENFLSDLKINNFFQSGGRNKTHNDAKYVRYFWEVNINEINNYWKLYLNGGTFKQYYGNNIEIVNWRDNAKKEYKSHGGLLKQESVESFGIYWNKITSNFPGFCFKDKNWIFSSNAPTIICDDIKLTLTALGYFNSKVAHYFLSAINPTMTTNVGDVLSMPFNDVNYAVNNIVCGNISISKTDWDSFETSWDFQTHPLLAPSSLDMAGLIMAKQPTLAERYEQFKAICEDRFDILQENEEELNRIFIDIYGLKDELTPDVAPKDVTVHQIFDSKDDVPDDLQGSNYVLTKEDVMKSLLSYAVGCLFGRYSLDTPGLAYAGDEWDADTYQTFIPDNDNVVPITDEEYFDDDLSSFICAWLKKAFGRENFEANLEFLTDALGTRGTTSREKLRNYFLKNFYKDHCKTYQKRPIYWLFDSGKENGFKALVYLHRYDENTIGRVRADYLHRMERIYSNEVNRMQDVIDHSHSAHEVSVAEKRLEKMKKQIKECQDYDAKLGHLALDQIHLDLDDGVKINYRKAQTGRDGKFYEVLADSKAIMAKDALWHEYLTEWPHEKE